MGTLRTLDDLSDVAGKRILVRVDLNVPMEDGKITDKTRIERVAPTISELSVKGAKVVLLSHFGRPKGAEDPQFSLRPVADAVEEILDHRVDFATDSIGEEARSEIAEMANGDVVLLENTRFYPGEESNDPAYAKELADLGDLYVNDAFSAAHRAHASTEGVAHLLPSYAGRAMQAELQALEAALGKPERPVIAIVGGAKVSTKIDLLMNLTSRVDAIVIGGGMANTLLAATGVSVGKSLHEPDLFDTARKIMAKAASHGCAIILPIDAVVAEELEQGVVSRTVRIEDVADSDMILDVGPKTAKAVNAWIDRAKTLIWNGPLGAFETEPFDKGTIAAAKRAAKRARGGDLIAVAGGGDTVSALNRAGVAGDFTYVSTAGGAFLEWMEGKPLPGVKALMN